METEGGGGIPDGVQEKRSVLGLEVRPVQGAWLVPYDQSEGNLR